MVQVDALRWAIEVKIKVFGTPEDTGNSSWWLSLTMIGSKVSDMDDLG